MKSSPEELTVGEVSRRTGVAVSALHFYESKGLISSHRNSGNQRRYPRDVLRRVSLIKVAQNLGVSLAEIKEALDQLPPDKKASMTDWKRMATKWNQRLDDRIHLLTKLRNELMGCIGCGCLSMQECPLRNSRDNLARKGTGPRLLGS